ncbi:MAG: hypothetical protein HY652_14970 [Acidobacteria bacterium]|nr:hypothetical protein [Acidobacteriota bacterium]
MFPELFVILTLVALIIAGAFYIRSVTQSHRRASLSEFYAKIGQDRRAFGVDKRQIHRTVSQAMLQNPPPELVRLQELQMEFHRPLPDWGSLITLRLEDLLIENGMDLDELAAFSRPLGASPGRAIRFEERYHLQMRPDTRLNGVALRHDQLTRVNPLRERGLVYWNSFAAVAIRPETIPAEKPPVLDDFRTKLLSIYLDAVKFFQEPGDDPLRVLTAMHRFKSVEVNGSLLDFAMERWALAVKGKQLHHLVEIVFVPQCRQPDKVWKGLQTYLQSFHALVIY